MVNNIFETVEYEDSDFEDKIDQYEVLARFYHLYQQRNPGLNLQQAVHHTLTLLLPIKDDPRHCTEIECQALFNTGAQQLHRLYLSQDPSRQPCALHRPVPHAPRRDPSRQHAHIQRVPPGACQVRTQWQVPRRQAPPHHPAHVRR